MSGPLALDVQLFRGETRPVVGVSGGVDSMVLLHLMTSFGLSPFVAHVNYGLRGTDSDHDQQLVEETCSRLGLRLHVLTVDESPSTGESTQVWARRVRYAWFEQLAKRLGVGVVVTAHHMDDQAETILINLMRGTGPEGLSGMTGTRPLGEGGEIMLVRPLLEASRWQIQAYAGQHGIAWREDRSNRDPAYGRTRARTLLATGELDPILMSTKAPPPDTRPHDTPLHDTLPPDTPPPGAPPTGAAPPKKDSAAHQLAVMGTRVRQFLERDLLFALPEQLQQALDQGEDLPVKPLRALPTAVRGWVMLRALALTAPDFPRRRSTVEALDRLILAQPGSRLIQKNWEVWRNRDVLSVRERRDRPEEVEFDVGSSVDVREGVLDTTYMPLPESLFDTEKAFPPQNGDESSVLGTPRLLATPRVYSEWVDAERVAERLTLRPWEPGDRFVPLGAPGSKKVKDFLTDVRVASSEKHRVLVLVSGGDIVWVVGYRLDDRFKLTSHSQKALKLTWTPTRNP